MPKGSAYPGSPDDLERYRALVERHGEAELKGAKNPYTSLNGWMTSFLDPDGQICLRLARDSHDDLLAAGGAAVQQYGRNMPDFVALPAGADDMTADSWFERSWNHTGSLDPK